MKTPNLSLVKTPAYVIDLEALENNAKILADVQARAGCKIVLALKGFATWSTFSVLKPYLAGVAASSPDEARLGREEFGKDVLSYAVAYDDESFEEICELSNHVVFNSVSQWQRFADRARAKSGVEFGLRVNPQHSEVAVALYDPCAVGSRLGATVDTLQGADLSGLSGLHFHTLCELGSDALQRTLGVVEEKFAPWLEKVQWVNFGGGHHITKPDYDRDLLVKLIKGFRERWNVDVYLEPGEAVAIGTGTLVSSVLDITHNGMDIAVLDTSATAHMPDVLEMPYRPVVTGGGAAGEKPHLYRLGGLTCLAGDVIGDYTFDAPLNVGDKLVFEDMSHYTVVKTTTFNGVKHPSIVLYDPRNGAVRVAREFGYENYKNRLS
ncbi:MAG: carboxynorspermidine decarboxylase [Polyangiales bacterium]